MIFHRALCIALTFVFSIAIVKAENGITSKYESCINRTGGVTSEMIRCISQETDYQDKRLNKNYKELIAGLNPMRKKQLQEAQRAWIQYKEANCRFYADPDGGTIARVNANECILSSTARRASELERFKEQ